MKVAMGFISRSNASKTSRVAERRLNIARDFNRRYATREFVGVLPWLESHGYRHQVAPRLITSVCIARVRLKVPGNAGNF